MIDTQLLLPELPIVKNRVECFYAACLCRLACPIVFVDDRNSRQGRSCAVSEVLGRTCSDVGCNTQYYEYMKVSDRFR